MIEKFTIPVTPLTGKTPRIVQLYLDGLEKRPPRATRLRIALSMGSVNEVNVKVTDLGFHKAVVVILVGGG